jgi:hypothetical protein
MAMRIDVHGKRIERLMDGGRSVARARCRHPLARAPRWRGTDTA